MADYVAYVRLTAPKAPDGWVHTGTDYQIALDSNFSNILYEVYNDQENLLELTRIFQVPGPYYARAAFRFTDGVTEWSQPTTCEITGGVV